MSHTPERGGQASDQDSNRARAGMATTADISTGVHPTKKQGQAHMWVTLPSPTPTLVDPNNRPTNTHSAYVPFSDTRRNARYGDIFADLGRARKTTKPSVPGRARTQDVDSDLSRCKVDSECTGQ